MASIMCGFGAKKCNKLCETLNVPGLNQKTFHNHCDAVYALTPEIKQHIQLAVQVVCYEHQQLDQTLAHDDIYDTAVSYDGSWLTRGHSSQIGVTCVIDLLTGLCVDFHVLSKYCQKCETTGKKEKEKEKRKQLDHLPTRFGTKTTCLSARRILMVLLA